MATSVAVPTHDLTSGLTPSQREAVLHTGSPLLIIAGPGSGKTEVLTRRVAHLIRSGHVEPAHCLVTTFSNKAALELKDRIQQRLPDADVEQMPFDPEAPAGADPHPPKGVRTR